MCTIVSILIDCNGSHPNLNIHLPIIIANTTKDNLTENIYQDEITETLLSSPFSMKYYDNNIITAVYREK